jgi:transcriptional regulator with XRE-family HTH domain
MLTAREPITITAEEVQRRREALGWSQNELARRIRKHPGHLSRVLRGLMPSAPVWEQIAKVLDRAEARQGRRQGVA